MTPRVLLAGAFGQGNPGDEALLEACRRGLADWELTVTSSRPTDGADVVATAEPRRVARALMAADAVVFGGGTIFKTLCPRTRRPPLDLLRKALALAFGARALGKPVALVGVGAAPLDDPQARRLARRLVAHADLLVLRDEDSADVLRAAGAPAPFRVGADLAWTLLEDAPAPRDEPRGGGVVVAVSHEAADGSSALRALGELADALAAGLVPVLAAGHAVTLQPWQVGAPAPVDDLDLARAIARRLGGAAEVVLPPADLVEAGERFAEARLVVGLRFHALVAAAAAGTPFVAVAHEPKLRALARRLDQPWVSPAPDGLRADALSGAILTALDAPTPPSAAEVRAEVARAEQGMQLLRLVLRRGDSAEADSIGALPLLPEEWAS